MVRQSPNEASAFAYSLQRIINLIAHIRYPPFDNVAKLLWVNIKVCLANNAALVLLHLVLTISVDAREKSCTCNFQTVLRLNQPMRRKDGHKPIKVLDV